MSKPIQNSWVSVASLDEFADVDRKAVDVNGTRLGLFKVGEVFYCVSAYCTHARVDLLEGDLDEYEIMCPMHGALFDIRNGEVLAPPAYKGLQTYPVRVEDGHVLIQWES